MSEHEPGLPVSISETDQQELLSGDVTRIRAVMANLPPVAVRELEQMADFKTEAALEIRARPVRIFHQVLRSDNVLDDGRRGILRKYDPVTGEQLSLREHQVSAIRKLISQDANLDDSQRHAVLLLFHELGLGKTVTGMAAVAAVHMRRTDATKPLKILIIAPIQVISFHKTACVRWLTIAESKLLLARYQSDLTEDAVRHATIIFTTPSCLKEAYDTYNWKNPQHRSIGVPGVSTVRYIAGLEPRKTPRPSDLARNPRLDPAAPPPIHPLFDPAIVPRFDLIVFDECQKASNPKTWWSAAIGTLAERSTSVIAGSGTPVRGKVAEIAGLCRVARIQPDRFQSKASWIPPGLKDGIRRAVLNELHERFVHLATEHAVQMPTVRRVTLEFSPFVGRKADGTFSQLVIDEYNAEVRSAQEMIASANTDAGLARSIMGRLMKAVLRTEQACFDFHLMQRTAAAYKTKVDAPISLANPSEQVKLLWRLVRSRQKAGRVRVVLYSAQTSYIEISAAYFAQMGGVGAIHKVVGSSRGQTRDRTVVNFLAATRAVLFISAAGGEGINLAPGAEVVISFGSMPWSSEEKRQAEARVIRMTQTESVELIDVIPERSTMQAKLDNIHQDKSDRLVAAIKLNNFSNFSKVDAEKAMWRERLTIGRAMLPVDNSGNHVFGPQAHKEIAEYQTAAFAAIRAGQPAPEVPEIVRKVQQPPVLAYNLALPPVSFPVEGFIEPEHVSVAVSRPPPKPTSSSVSSAGSVGSVGSSVFAAMEDKVSGRRVVTGTKARPAGTPTAPDLSVARRMARQMAGEPSSSDDDEE